MRFSPKKMVPGKKKNNYFDFEMMFWYTRIVCQMALGFLYSLSFPEAFWVVVELF